MEAMIPTSACCQISPLLTVMTRACCKEVVFVDRIAHFLPVSVHNVPSCFLRHGSAGKDAAIREHHVFWRFCVSVVLKPRHKEEGRSHTVLFAKLGTRHLREYEVSTPAAAMRKWTVPRRASTPSAIVNQLSGYSVHSPREPASGAPNCPGRGWPDGVPSEARPNCSSGCWVW